MAEFLARLNLNYFVLGKKGQVKPYFENNKKPFLTWGLALSVKAFSLTRTIIGFVFTGIFVKIDLRLKF